MSRPPWKDGREPDEKPQPERPPFPPGLDTLTCDVCGDELPAGSDEIGHKIVEYDGSREGVLSAEWTLCAGCYRELVTPGPTCPFCLEPVMQDEDPADCPARPEADR